MVVLKVNGDLTINEEAKLTAYASKNGYGGPKGMMIYCTGTLTNNGTISMTARGAKAEGKNVYLWKNSDNSYEFVPAVGAEGGVKSQVVGNSIFGGRYSKIGNSGKNATSRQTAGGGSGTALCTDTSDRCAATMVQGQYITAKNGNINGGAGGNGVGNYNDEDGGGAGNPGGTGGADITKAENGTGGLLIIYANNIINNSIIEANGSNGGTGSISVGQILNVTYTSTYTNY